MVLPLFHIGSVTVSPSKSRYSTALAPVRLLRSGVTLAEASCAGTITGSFLGRGSEKHITSERCFSWISTCPAVCSEITQASSSCGSRIIPPILLPLLPKEKLPVRGPVNSPPMRTQPSSSGCTKFTRPMTCSPPSSGITTLSPRLSEANGAREPGSKVAERPGSFVPVAFAFRKCADLGLSFSPWVTVGEAHN
ncbi:MAG: hypothetical protein JW395_3327 [Nitrospira sp.]|nr:hypothetical protein [Nitrospira sp.]